MEECINNIRENLYKIWSGKDWSLISLSIACDISYRHLCNILYGKCVDVKLSTLLRISNGLEIPISVLIGEKEELVINHKERDAAFIKSLHSEIETYIKKNGIEQ